MPRPFQKLLVANRGEIAIRIFRAATELGLRTVGIYSHEDRLSLHRYKADEAWRVGKEGEPLQAYLDIESILALAKSRDVDAIHPGYGFLSENETFARRCAEEGIVFIGPSPESISRLGDKVSARQLAQQANVPVVPGTAEPLQNVEEALTFAKKVGFPVMLKAAYGGGGRGMRRVYEETDLREAYEAAERESRSAFGRGELFLEKLVEQPRHIEVQILGDQEGHIVHLFERDCSVQRRHQKVVEVAPALGLSERTRNALFEAALRVAREANLYNAATVEFLVDPAVASENKKDGDPLGFYFIEVNPRLQVEHTITELITGIDIVQSQIRIAEGHTLKDLGLAQQNDVQSRGAAIQARITTEDPRKGFVPDTGRVTAYRSAAGFGIRLDVGIAGAGAEITPYYDSMLVKVSAFALSHQEAARKLSRSLKEFRIRGVATNIQFLDNIANHPDFLAGKMDTGFVERTTSTLVDFSRRKNRATRLLTNLADTLVNGPPGSDGPLARPAVVVEAQVPPAVEQPPREKFGFKEILDRNGPKALARAIREEPKLLLTDTTFRDAHQSLLATRIRTHDMARIAAATEERLPNLFSLECWGGATFDVAYRFLREDPWDRLQRIRQAMPQTLLQMLLRGSNAVGYTNYPENVVRRFVQLAAHNGVDVFRIFDCFNQLDAMRTSIEEVQNAGKVCELAICYTGNIDDPQRSKYNIDYYRRKAVEFANAGADILAIKDMAGLLRPSAAERLILALRAEVDVPIHVHTHDTSGNGVAAMLSAARAGADVVDCALASMSGLTSQPSLDAIVAALEGTERDPAFDMRHVQELSDYWEAVRTLYAPFESGLRASTADVYHHEIPGGQYSNLKPQALAVGLSAQWNEVRERYREVNFALGDIIKVTPSSKVVGDFALWLVKNGLTVDDLMNSDEHFDLPKSVVGLFEGHIGTPEGGFPEALRRRVLGANPTPLPAEDSKTLPSYPFAEKKAELEKAYEGKIAEELEVSYALYPQVVKDYLDFRSQFGDVSVLDTETFLYGLQQNREALIELEPGKALIVERTAIGELREDKTRDVHFALNGQPRTVRVLDRGAAADRPQRVKALPGDPLEVGAPMPGNVLSIGCKVGDVVEEDQILLVVEAMKLETNVRSAQRGRVSEILVQNKDVVEAGDLLVRLDALV